jgi:CRISPR-associated endonuclease/helicase Cas3
LFSHFLEGRLPAALDLPTGLGKTSVVAIWLIARAYGAELPRRLVYVVDRRAVVDQATTEAEKLRDGLECLPHLKNALKLGRQKKLSISTLRGKFVDNAEWLADPTVPAIVVGTVDMIGSRLLFAGYGVSRKMRPYHAGLLGADALFVLDEAHLVPPFAHLLRTIERRDGLGARDDGARAILPRFTVLPLSATQRRSHEAEGDQESFHLEQEDEADAIVAKRLFARKRLRLEPLDGSNADKQLALAAWELARKDDVPFRVVVFCDRRDKQDGGGGPSARGVADEIEKLGRASKVDIRAPELLVGGRRVREREDVATSLRDLGFLGEKAPLEKPAYLVATSAGEVGIDVDADHMVCDLVAWERMVQRLGRVNRRGEDDSGVVVFWGEPSIKDKTEPTDAEKRSSTALAAQAVIEKLPQIDGGFDASPAAVLGLAERARSDSELGMLVAKAATPEPLRPPLTRAHVEAWSMTSLEVHTGRPDVAPWLRGWIDDDKPQATVVWRKFLPVRIEGDPVSKQEIGAFFEAAPPHASEELETETFRVVDWLTSRASRLVEKLDEASNAPNGIDEASDLPTLTKDSFVAFVLGRDGKLLESYRLRNLVESDDDKKRKDRLETELSDATAVVDARLCGLRKGLLSAEEDEPPPTADSSDDWSRRVGVRIREAPTLEAVDSDRREWRFEASFAAARNSEGEVTEWLIVEHLRTSGNAEDARSISNPQLLDAHQASARSKASRIAAEVGLTGEAARALEVAARLHDEGKKAPRWQRAFNAERDKKKFDLAGPLAKTRGPINQALLDGYRHEFGSLPYVADDAEFQGLPEDLKDLVLHLVAAHHGGARPLISTKSCDDAPPSALEARARDVALRFAKLQKIWGPWGLAWWEALLRAADQQASRENDSRGSATEREAE